MPNGWTYQYPVQLELTPQGICLEGIGIFPDVTIENRPENVEDQQDKIIERALQYLFEVYGIE